MCLYSITRVCWHLRTRLRRPLLALVPRPKTIRFFPPFINVIGLNTSRGIMTSPNSQRHTTLFGKTLQFTYNIGFYQDSETTTP